jgi:3-methyl-2-oxobutanoate hydroxymethyltransferase
MRIRISHLKDRKRRGEKIAMLTAYDATIAKLLERAGIDVILVGDSVATAVLGYDTTLPVSLDVMIHHTAAVVRGTERALVVADMPFLTYQVSPSEAVRNAGRLLKDAGAAAVKVEGGRSVVEVVRRLVDVGIPVMGHLGVLPQSVNQQSGYRQRGAEEREADLILSDALALQDAGAFALVLEAGALRPCRQNHTRPRNSHDWDRCRATLRWSGARHFGRAWIARQDSAVRAPVRQPRGVDCERRPSVRRRREVGPRRCDTARWDRRGFSEPGRSRFAQCSKRLRPLPLCGSGCGTIAKPRSSALCRRWARCTRGTPN